MCVCVPPIAAQYTVEKAVAFQNAAATITRCRHPVTVVCHAWYILGEKIVHLVSLSIAYITQHAHRERERAASASADGLLLLLLCPLF